MSTNQASVCSAMLKEGDRRLDDKFLELERQQLERSLSASASTPSTRDVDAATGGEASSGGSSGSSRRAPAPSPWDGPPPGAAGAAALSAPKPRPVVAEWWTAGQNALMDGALKELVEEVEPQYSGARLIASRHDFACPHVHDVLRVIQL
jgi:hypothetical protein